jgi:hypothetical protein
VTTGATLLTFAERRKMTIIPGARFRPLRRSSPPAETMCGWLPHTLGGQHLTDVTWGA